MVDVFISYARANRDVVCRLAEAIGRLGYVVWWDEELPAHLSYGEVITQKIGEAKATLVVWSAESAASEWVRAEADMARHEKKLIQTSIDDCVPPLPFNQIQYAAIGDWDGADDHTGWRKARASLAALCGPAPAETAVPVPAPATVVSGTLAAGWALPSAAPAAQPQLQSQPYAAWPAPRRNANRIALVAIAASVLTILTVGGLMLVKGPPSAHAHTQAVAAPVARQAQASAPAAAPALTPPKNGSVDVAVGSGGATVEGAEAGQASEQLDPADDF